MTFGDDEQQERQHDEQQEVDHAHQSSSIDLLQPLLPERSELPVHENQQRNSRNAKRILALSGFSSLGRSIWSQNVLSVLVYMNYPSHAEYVGFLTTAMGMGQVVASVPINSMLVLRSSDQNAVLLPSASVLGLVAIVVTAFALITGNYVELLCGLFLWGVLGGLTDKALSSVFMESVPEGAEAAFYGWGSFLLRTSNVLGPCIALVVFAFLGNEWHPDSCHIVLLSGLGLCLPVTILLCLVSKALPVPLIDGNEEEFHDESQEHHCSGESAKQDTETYRGDSSSEEAHQEDESCVDDEENSWTSNATLSKGCCYAPRFVRAAQVLSAVASGMSTRYFPVFMMSRLGVSPIWMQLLYMVLPLFQQMTMKLTISLAHFLDPSLVFLLMHWLFAATLGSLVHYSGDDFTDNWVPLGLCFMHLSLVGSTSDLARSIMMSSAHSEDISSSGWLNALELTLWSLGAAAGGIAVTYQGLLFNFVATIAVQLIGTIPLLFLCCVGPKGRLVRDTFS